MFAAPVAKARAKMPPSSTNSFTGQRSSLVAHRSDHAQMVQRTIVNQAILGNEQGADPLSPATREAIPVMSWDFSTIPVFPPDQVNRPEARPSLSVPSPPSVLQPKLAIGQISDPLEHEADSVADQVMRMPDPEVAPAFGPPQISRKCAVCEEEGQKLQERPAGAAQPIAGEAPASVHDVLQSPGQALDPATRLFFEPRFGRNLDNIRVHTNDNAGRSAQAVNAFAYTVGANIVFAPGRYAPHSERGRRLIAHELTHAVQQSNGPNRTIQRQPSPTAGVEPEAAATPDKGRGDKAEGTPSAGGRVVRLVIATEDGVLTVETLEADYLYELDQWDIPEGSHIAAVSIKGKDVVFDFGKDFDGQLFHFTYRINQGQDNPATLLKGQKNVIVDVVAKHDLDPETKPIRCLLPISTRVLIKEAKSATPLFKPVTKNTKWFLGKVPLGFLGWIDVNAEAGLSLAGLLSYGWGPGVLSDVCLFRKVDLNVFGGSARFKFGAALSPSINAKGKLKAVASYAGAVDLVSAIGELDASAAGRLSGNLDARVDLEYDRRQDVWGFDAEALISGSAGLKLTATASAAIEMLYKEVWSKQWKLIDADFRIGWTGGLRIGTDTRPRFDFGNVGILSGDEKAAQPGGPDLPTATAPDPLATEAKVDEQKVLEAAINEDTGDPARIPQGETPDDALPIIWYKPLNIYPKEIAIPRAIRPERLDRDDGPTLVEYGAARRRTAREFIGVGEDDKTNQTNWPLPVRSATGPGKTFQYIEKTEGDTVKNRLRDAFNNELLPAGQTLAGNGYDMDHVHEKQFSGQDAPPNLWPAQSSANRRAGDLHNEQLNEYRRTIRNIVGRWFEIVSVRNP